MGEGNDMGEGNAATKDRERRQLEAVFALEAELRGFLDEEGLAFAFDPEKTFGSEGLVSLVDRDGTPSTVTLTLGEGDFPWSVRADGYRIEHFDDGWRGVHLLTSDRTGPFGPTDWKGIAGRVRDAFVAAEHKFVPNDDKTLGDPHVVLVGLAFRDLGAKDVRGVKDARETMTADLHGTTVTVTATENGVEIDHPGGSSAVDLHGGAQEYNALRGVLLAIRDAPGTKPPGM